jgi:hypothetical protein
MFNNILKFSSFFAMVLCAQGVVAGQFVVELGAALKPLSTAMLDDHDVLLDESFSAGSNSYAVFTAKDQNSLGEFLAAAFVDPEKISAVLFVNSPTVGGGKQAGSAPREGHNVYVIERPIPGVGFLGLEKMKKIAMNSNTAIEKLGKTIEWEQSYLTSEGTYCVYRADSPETLREHGALAGAPIGKITTVIQQSY